MEMVACADVQGTRRQRPLAQDRRILLGPDGRRPPRQMLRKPQPGAEPGRRSVLATSGQAVADRARSWSQVTFSTCRAGAACGGEPAGGARYGDAFHATLLERECRPPVETVTDIMESSDG